MREHPHDRMTMSVGTGLCVLLLVRAKVPFWCHCLLSAGDTCGSKRRGRGLTKRRRAGWRPMEVTESALWDKLLL